jgi:hypothetical protein
MAPRASLIVLRVAITCLIKVNVGDTLVMTMGIMDRTACRRRCKCRGATRICRAPGRHERAMQGTSGLALAIALRC